MQSNVLTSSVFVGSWSEKFASEDELPRHANVRADHDAAHAENENETLQRNGTHSNNKAKKYKPNGGNGSSTRGREKARALMALPKTRHAHR